MQIELDIASFKVPGNQRTVMTTSVYQLIYIVVGNAHNIVMMSTSLKILELTPSGRF